LPGAPLRRTYYLCGMNTQRSLHLAWPLKVFRGIPCTKNVLAKHTHTKPSPNPKNKDE